MVYILPGSFASIAPKWYRKMKFNFAGVELDVASIAPKWYRKAAHPYKSTAP